MNRFLGKKVILVLLLLVTSGWWAIAVRSKRALPAESGLPISSSGVAQDLKYLSSDELTGRLSGSPGAEKAAEYIANEFRRLGLKSDSSSPGYQQQFSFISGMDLGADNRVSIQTTAGEQLLELRKDFMPAAFSISGTFEGQAVFAGFGISAPALNYDDYDGLNVKDRFVFVLRYGPEGNNPHSEFNRFHALRHKAMTAREKGAQGIIFADDQEDFSKSTLSKLRFDTEFSDSGIAAFGLSLPVTREIFRKSGLDLDVLQKSVSSKKPSSVELPGVRLNVHAALRKVMKSTSNVVGMFLGTDPRLKEEAVVIGAHYDHLGLGEAGSLSEAHGKEIHNGADDNASGTAGVLDLARSFAARKGELKRSLVFLTFSGEEEGLLGSKYYVAHPSIPLDKTVAMVNMDMIGRMKDNRLTVGGSGSSPIWRELLGQLNENSELTLKFDDDGYGPSDHASFYAKDIPVLFFFTGVHQDYHRPSDDYEKINLAGTQKVLKLVFETIVSLTQREERPLFSKAKDSPGSRGRGDFQVYLGTIPDYGEEVEGVKLSGVREGSPAAKAGLKGGDIIVECGGKQVKNVYDYTYILGDHKAGDILPIVVLREKERIQLQATLELRP